VPACLPGDGETISRDHSVVSEVGQSAELSSDLSVRKVSHQVHYQGLVTDQALCLVPLGELRLPQWTTLQGQPGPASAPATVPALTMLESFKSST